MKKEKQNAVRNISGVIIVAVMILTGFTHGFGAHSPGKEKAGPEGDPKRGEVLFKTPMMLGTIPISCANCHPDGMGLERAYGRNEYSIFGHKAKRIEAVIEFWIVNILRGKMIPYDSSEMRDIKAYLKFLSTRPQKPLPKMTPLEMLDYDVLDYGG